MENDKRLGFPFTVRDMLSFQHGAAFSLKITTLASETSTIIIRGMTSEGLFSFKQNLIATSVPFVNTYRIPDVPIWVSVTTPDEAIPQGSIYATLNIEINGDTLYELCSGLVYTGKSLSWPYSNTTDKRPGGGKIMTQSSTFGGAGAEMTFTIPDGEIWLIKSLRFQLTTSATVATRRVHILLQQVAILHLHMPATVTQAASLTYDYSVAPYAQYFTAVIDNDVIINMPKHLLLTAGDKIVSATTSLQAGDYFSQMLIEYEQFFL